MIYPILKIFSRIGIKIWCRHIIVNKPGHLKDNGPLLLASNHPNSFLDGILFDTLFEKPVHSLARGDVFKKAFHARLLKSIKILPVYRTSEGTENLSHNYATFEACREIFRHQGVVCIFSEGQCINEWHLRPLKKGTARLAIKAWEEAIPLKVLPVGINYSSFRRFGKNIIINFGDLIEIKDIDTTAPDGIRYQAFNNNLQSQLEKLVFEIPKEDKQKQKQLLERKPGSMEKIFLFIPALIGWLIHLPLFLPIKKFTWKRTKDNDHFDSVMLAILFFAYPLYILLITGLVWAITGSTWAFLLLILFPITAWSYTRIKSQLDP